MLYSLYFIAVSVFIFINVVCDVKYFVRFLFIMISSRMFKSKSKHDLQNVTTIYGLGTFEDCDVKFNHVRLARLVRELDMARYHYYELTGIYKRVLELNIHSVQGSTLTVSEEHVPLFTPYKINTKLVYWDDRSFFLEHEVVTISDNKCRCLFVSRQHALDQNDQPTDALLKDLPGSEIRPNCPKYIEKWLDSMEITSAKLRKA